MPFSSTLPFCFLLNSLLFSINRVIDCLIYLKIFSFHLFMKDHEMKCAFQVKQCQFCDESFEKENENSHLSKCKGFFKEGPCLYKNVGCTYIVSLFYFILCVLVVIMVLLLLDILQRNSYSHHPMCNLVKN